MVFINDSVLAQVCGAPPLMKAAVAVPAVHQVHSRTSPSALDRAGVRFAKVTQRFFIACTVKGVDADSACAARVFLVVWCYDLQASLAC